MSKRISKAMGKHTNAVDLLAGKKLGQVSVVNLKVEQVLRAIYFGFDKPDALQVSPVGGHAITLFKPDELIECGVADEKGYRFAAASNSALVALGYHPTAVLLWLSQMRLNGQPVVFLKDNKLVVLHCAAAQCARDVVFNYEKLAMVKGKPRVVSKPILDNYKRVGKPALFA